MALSMKRRAFVEEYLKDFNATQAAIRAGYSERSASQIGHENLNIPEIADKIQRRIDEKAMTADEVLLRLAEQARGEHAAYIRPNGAVDLPRLIKDDKSHLIKGTKWDSSGNLIVEFHDAQSALVQIGKYHKLFTERHEHGGFDGDAIPIRLEDVLEAQRATDEYEQDKLSGTDSS